MFGFLWAPLKDIAVALFSSIYFWWAASLGGTYWLTNRWAQESADARLTAAVEKLEKEHLTRSLALANKLIQSNLDVAQRNAELEKQNKDVIAEYAKLQQEQSATLDEERKQYEIARQAALKAGAKACPVLPPSRSAKITASSTLNRALIKLGE